MMDSWHIDPTRVSFYTERTGTSKQHLCSAIVDDHQTSDLQVQYQYLARFCIFRIADIKLQIKIIKKITLYFQRARFEVITHNSKSIFWILPLFKNFEIRTVLPEHPISSLFAHGVMILATGCKKALTVFTLLAEDENGWLQPWGQGKFEWFSMPFLL